MPPLPEVAAYGLQGRVDLVVPLFWPGPSELAPPWLIWLGPADNWYSQDC